MLSESVHERRIRTFDHVAGVIPDAAERCARRSIHGKKHVAGTIGREAQGRVRSSERPGARAATATAEGGVHRDRISTYPVNVARVHLRTTTATTIIFGGLHDGRFGATKNTAVITRSRLRSNDASASAPSSFSHRPLRAP